jgi:hypothetical protein
VTPFQGLAPGLSMLIGVGGSSRGWGDALSRARAGAFDAHRCWRIVALALSSRAGQVSDLAPLAGLTALHYVSEARRATLARTLGKRGEIVQVVIKTIN